MSCLAASYDLVPDFMNHNMSYDPMLVLWHEQQISYYIEPSLPIAQILYTVMACGLTAAVHYRILTHLKEKFVNLPGITQQIRDNRHKQNLQNFQVKLALFCQEIMANIGFFRAASCFWLGGLFQSFYHA